MLAAFAIRFTSVWVGLIDSAFGQFDNFYYKCFTMRLKDGITIEARALVHPSEVLIAFPQVDLRAIAVISNLSIMTKEKINAFVAIWNHDFTGQPLVDLVQKSGTA
ncbi:hypothetical protein VNO77_43263 [Canavalia gladiata]|uniref:Uncharacterized protein n=1 Tax=Canavalia gladiata TaxID=3824 RepID=A0AAN9PPW2_CANGL